MALSPSTLIYTSLRTLQSLLSVLCLCIYATSLATSPSPSSSIYALVCCTVTLLTLSIYSIPSFPTRSLFIWDFCLGVLWAALAGVFGMMYLGHNEQNKDQNKTRMIVAVAGDLIGMACWIVTFLWGLLGWCNAGVEKRKARKEEKVLGRMLEGQEEGVVEMEEDSDVDCEKGLMGEKSGKGWTEGKCDKA